LGRRPKLTSIGTEVGKMRQACRFIVEVHSSYIVEAEAPDSALQVVLPMAPSADNVSYSVRRLSEPPAVTIEASRDPYAHLTRSAYRANEVAEILGVSKSVVYEKVPCIQVGSRRLYPRATIIDLLRNGLKKAESVLQPVERRWKESPRRTAKVVSFALPERTRDLPDAPKPLSMKEAAKLLRISYAKARELFETRKIYSSNHYGKRIIPTSAIEHFLEGKTPAQFVEVLIERARADGIFKDDPKALEEAANELRREWPE